MQSRLGSLVALEAQQPRLQPELIVHAIIAMTISAAALLRGTAFLWPRVPSPTSA